jgi:RNA polymerase sigma-70 factor (ECF subfamily)
MLSQQEKNRFIGIIEQNKKLIFKVCHSYCRDPDDRKNLVQKPDMTS